jgi:hypothetical protein
MHRTALFLCDLPHRPKPSADTPNTIYLALSQVECSGNDTLTLLCITIHQIDGLFPCSEHGWNLSGDR